MLALGHGGGNFIERFLTDRFTRSTGRSQRFLAETLALCRFGRLFDEPPSHPKSLTGGYACRLLFFVCPYFGF
ncbi:MAG: hypothetical protein LRY39_01695 [Alphaproteobacteria bacterium]|nr:hypothetical protein [Alphaproteobacteria bacterium]